MTLDEILSELSKLQPDERELVGKKLHELDMEEIRQWLRRRESEPVSPEDHWIHAFDEWRGSIPDDQWAQKR